MIKNNTNIKPSTNFKEELFEVVCRITNNVEENCWEEYWQKSTKQAGAELGQAQVKLEVISYSLSKKNKCTYT